MAWFCSGFAGNFGRRLLLGGCAVAVGIAGAAAAGAEPALRKVSGLSPFAGCTADTVASQPGINFPDTEIEPWLAVNPANSRNLIAGWQQDRWSDGGARGLVAGVSIDGGATWARLVPPNISKCSGGIYDRASDPWVAISPNGTAYFLSLAFNNNRPDGGGGQNAVLVNRSRNGGISWSSAIPLIVDTDGQISNDKESMTADPLDSRYAYAVWGRIRDFTLPPGKQSGAAAAANPERMRDGAITARERRRMLKAMSPHTTSAQSAAPIFKGPAMFVRTTNGGISWEPPEIIYDPGDNAQTINNIVAVFPNGVVANFFTNITAGGETSIGIQKSFNKGKSFAPATLPVGTTITFTGTRTPDRHDPVRDANILFDVAVDPDNGNLYVVWQDGRFEGIDKVVFSMSTDGGSNWSEPALIAMTPPNPVRLRNQSFIPSVEVGANHQIVVTYYDFRFDRSNGQEAADYFAVFCTPNLKIDCSRRWNWGDGATALRDIRLTPQSFDMLDAPVARGLFLGDYMGLARRGGAVIPAFGMADGPNKVSVYTVPIRSKTPPVNAAAP